MVLKQRVIFSSDAVQLVLEGVISGDEYVQSDAALEGHGESLAEGAGPGGCGLVGVFTYKFQILRLPVLVDLDLMAVDLDREPNEVRDMRQKHAQ